MRAHLLSYMRRLVHRYPRMGAVVRRLARPLKPFFPSLSPPGLAEDTKAYQTWLARQERLGRQDEQLIRQALTRIAERPQFLILISVERAAPRLLTETLAALRAQIYPHWQALLVTGRETSPAVRAELEAWASEDRRFQLRHVDIPGSRRGCALLSLVFEAERAAEGEPAFFIPLAAGDLLARSALAEAALTVALHPEVKLIYGDEDRIDPRGRRHTPYFKPDFDSELMLAQNLIGGFAAYRTDLLAALGDLPPPADVLLPGAAHEVLLRACEEAGGDIRHIPSLLCHRRDPSPLPPAEEAGLSAAGREAVANFLARKGIGAEILPAPSFPRLHRIVYALPPRLPKVSVIIPTRDRADLLKACLEGLLGRTDYPDLEVWIIDNESREPETFALFAALTEDPRVHRLRIPGPFNYSRLNNLAAAATTGEFLLLLNNDVKVIEPQWLKEMVGLALRPGIGAVGAKLLYPDNTIQHAGVVLGMGWPEGVAGHFYCHAPSRHIDPHGLLHVVRSVSAVTAACLLVRRSLFFEVGGFDEVNLEVAFNDVDFCLRLIERGYRNLWTPHATLYHFESASRGKDLSVEKAQRLYREINYMRQRWGALLDDDPYWNPNLALQDGMRRLSEVPRHMPVWLEVLGRAAAVE
jgi:GT2 family glycosyltransferase